MFRWGSAHSNHGTDYIDRVSSVVKLIRKSYSRKVPIIIAADSGFADQKGYQYFEVDLDRHYITTGKMYNDIKSYIQEIPTDTFGEIVNNKSLWQYVEFASKLKSRSKYRRSIFTRLHGVC